MNTLAAANRTYSAAERYLHTVLDDMDNTGSHIRGYLTETKTLKVFIDSELKISAKVFDYESMEISRYSNLKIADIRKIVAEHK